MREPRARTVTAVEDQFGVARNCIWNPEQEAPERHVDGAGHVTAPELGARSHVQDHRRVGASQTPRNVRGRDLVGSHDRTIPPGGMP